jgi:hypothetical protein
VTVVKVAHTWLRGLGGLAVAWVVLDACDQPRDPADLGEDLAVLSQGEALAKAFA